MSSSYGTSINQSTESATSSVLRSGLNISVGDTKSIVLALQALQQKIRSLEQDRNYHQEQYDRAIQAHEAYKLDMQRQVEKERADHRQREQELMELLRKAREEKVKLEAAVNGSHNELNTFHAELEKLIETEKEQSQQREGRLRGEMARLRQEINEERAKYTALMTSVEQLRGEREAALNTNEELRAAIGDMEQLRKQTAASTGASSIQRQQRRTGRRGVSASGPASRGRRALNGTVSPVKSSFSHSRLRDDMGHRTYRDPTCNSRLRDVRTAEGEVSCVCETVGAVNAAATVHNTSAADSRVGVSPQRSASASGSRTRPTPVFAAVNGGPRRHAQPHLSRYSDGSTPIAMVEAQLREELMELQREYRSTLDRASAEDLPRHVVNTALSRISDHIDQKEQQLRLMQVARREVHQSQTAPTAPTGGGGSSSADVMSDKATQRALLVNELRSMLAEGGGKL